MMDCENAGGAVEKHRCNRSIRQSALYGASIGLRQRKTGTGAWAADPCADDGCDGYCLYGGFGAHLPMLDARRQQVYIGLPVHEEKFEIVKEQCITGYPCVDCRVK